MNQNHYPRILILGGTNFMGKDLVDSLSRNIPNSVVCCVNRGKIYWNNQARTQHPEVQNFYCDRNQHKDTSATVAFVSKHLKIDQNNKWDLVVDFCAFEWRDIESVTKAIKNIARLYVFISSDSIYNNSKGRIQNPIRQQDFDLEEQYKLIKINKQVQDKYGYNKLKCQIYLNRIKPLPFVCLRLSDVIGPYQNTERFWCTVKWIQESKKYPISIMPDEQNIKICFISSTDVSSFILKLLTKDIPPSNAYNLCFRQTVTLRQFLQLVAKYIGTDLNLSSNGTHIKNDEQFQYGIGFKNSNNFFPSVQCGAISCEKALNETDWEPISIEQAIKDSVNFFMHKASNYADERKKMQKMFKRRVIGKD